MSRESCICHELYAGSTPTGSYNINEDCRLHGLGTKYWENKVMAYSMRTAELQRLARRARHATNETERDEIRREVKEWDVRERQQRESARMSGEAL